MAETGKEAERRRLAAALRANLGRRKAVGKPAPRRPHEDAGRPATSPSPADDRG